MIPIVSHDPVPPGRNRCFKQRGTSDGWIPADLVGMLAQRLGIQIEGDIWFIRGANELAPNWPTVQKDRVV